MKTILNKIILFGTAVNLFACGPVLYSNVGQNVPLLKKKREFSGQISYAESSGGWTGAGAGVQAAYAVTEKVGVISSFYSLASPKDPNDEWKGTGSYFEFGGGVFGGIQESKFRYEGFAGIGTASINNSSLITNRDFINVKYLKPFVQPTLAFSTEYFDIALTPRIAYLSYTSQNDFFFSPTSEQVSPQEFFDENHGKILFEPGIMIRGGFPGVKLEIQGNFSNLKDTSEEYILINQNYFSIGLRFIIADRTLRKD